MYEQSLTALDLGDNPELTKLYCANCKLTSLDLSANPKLTDLYCSDNGLTLLEISNCTALTDLSCRFNSLASLDVSRATELRDLDCGYNETIAALDLSRCKNSNAWIVPRTVLRSSTFRTILSWSPCAANRTH